MEGNYYDILGVSPDASLGEIKKAFRLLIKLHHPDKCGGADVESNKTKYLKVKQAFETLSDARARQEYDNWLQSAEGGGKEGNRAGDDNEVERARVADAAARFANSFFSGQGTKRRDEPEQLDTANLPGSGVRAFDTVQAEARGQSREYGRETSDHTELFQRLNVDNKPLSHSDGFEQWLRSRPVASLNVVNDETILRTQGAAVTTKDEVTQHQYTWPVTAIVRTAGDAELLERTRPADLHSLENSYRQRGVSRKTNGAAAHVSWSDEVNDTESSRADQRVGLKKVTLPKELQWGEVLVRILHAPVLPYDCVMLREGLDVLAAAADPVYGRGGSSSFTTTHAPPFATPVSPNEPGEDADIYLGSSCVAQVIEVGRGVKELKKGDIVLPLASSDGCWRAAAVWQERRLMVLPRDLLPKTEQAAVAKQLFLAYHLLQENAQHLRPGDAVLLYGSGCLVGQLLTQFCRLLGFRCFFVLRRSDHKNSASSRVKDYFKSLGATDVFDEEEDVISHLTRARQSLPQLAVELCPGTEICKSSRWLAKGSKVVLAYEAEACAYPSELAAPSLPELLSREIKVESFYLNGWLESRKNQQKMLKALEGIGALLRTEKLIVNLTEMQDLNELTVRGALLSVTKPWSEVTPHQQPLMTFPSLEAEKLAYEDKQKADMLREQEARQVQATLFAQRDRAPATARSNQAGEEKEICPKAAGESVEADLCLELPPTEKQEGGEPPLCFFVHERGETVEELHIMVKRYKQVAQETFQNAAFLFPTAPYEYRDDDIDVSSWAGEHVETLCAPVDGKRQFERRISAASKDATKIGHKQIEALKDLEASCECLADIIEEKTGVCGEKVRNVVLCGVGEGGLVALLTALTKLQFRVEAVVCIGMPLPDADILSFLLSKANKDAQKAKLFFLCGSKNARCPAWCQEALRQFFSDAGYCATKEVILDGGCETDERMLAHLAAVFSILKLS